MAGLARHLKAIWRQRCPRCLAGRVYQPGMIMNPRCPVCDLRFEREPGYFLGAMYISYALPTIILVSATFGLSLFLPDWDLGYLILIVGVLFLPFVPLVTRLSRVAWIHWDRWAWPRDADDEGNDKIPR